MTTLQQEHSRDAAYFGERPDWIIAASVHRDSDTVDRSNWTAFLAALGGESATVAIERSSHWAVGWVDYLVVDPANTKAIALIAELRARLEDYPLLDEMGHSALEWEEYSEAWANYGASEFCRELGKVFGLAEATKGFLAGCSHDALQTVFEACVTSGEYYTADGSSVRVNIESAIFHCTRKMLAGCLRQLRATA